MRYIMPEETKVENSPREFDYETEGDNDALYTAVMNGTANVNVESDKPKKVPWNKGLKYPLKPKNSIPDTDPVATPNMIALPAVNEDFFNTLFLIKGRVRRDAIGSDSVFAEQERLVWAKTFEEAVSKFTSYFAELSNYNERYTVVGAGGTEAIS